MKRSDYLKLCVSAAMLTYHKPKVLYDGIEYYPMEVAPDEFCSCGEKGRR